MERDDGKTSPNGEPARELDLHQQERRGREGSGRKGEKREERKREGGKREEEKEGGRKN